MDYNPLLPKISDVLEKHHKAMVFKKPELREVFKEPACNGCPETAAQYETDDL